MPPERRGVGIVPQEGALFPHLDVAANIGFGLRELGRGDRARRVAELLELVGLSGYERRRPHELSGGQQQRVAVARALAPRPAVVLLDEPFAALDTGLRATLRDDVGAALRAAATTAILVTHDQAEALTMADIVSVMREGAIVQSDVPEDLYLRPVDLATARFIGDVVVLPGTLNGNGSRAVRPRRRAGHRPRWPSWRLRRRRDVATRATRSGCNGCRERRRSSGPLRGSRRPRRSGARRARAARHVGRRSICRPSATPCASPSRGWPSPTRAPSGRHRRSRPCRRRRRTRRRRGAARGTAWR